jgi:hypothetical protein
MDVSRKFTRKGRLANLRDVDLGVMLRKFTRHRGNFSKAKRTGKARFAF